MPKLKKLSHALRQVDEESENYSSNKIDDNRSSHDSKSLLQVIPLKKMKMKHRDRVKLIEQYQKKSVNDNKAKTKSIRHSPKEQTRDDSVERYLTKFTDDDQSALTQESADLPIAENKKKKEIKVKNKFFSDCSFDETDYQQKEVVQQELIFEKKTIKNVDHLREKVQKKAQFFKNRLDFKNCDQDAKFKRNMQYKLQGLAQFQEVDVIIQMPKVMKGTNSYVDAALFLKNTKLENQGGFLSQPKEQENSQIPKDRKSFYDDLLKKMKNKRAESLTENVLKECFKKSKLSQEDFLFDLHSEQNQYPQRAKQFNKRNQLPQKKQRQESINHQKEQQYQTEPQKQYLVQHKQQDQIKQPPQKSQQPIEVIQVPQQELQQNNMSNNSLPEVVNAKQKIKTVRKKNKKKARKSFIKNLIEQQAQDSDDGGPKCPQEESNSDDDDNVSSLIDDDKLSICSQQQANAHKRFLKDMLDLEDKKFEQMQKKLRQQHDIQEERLRARMEDAAKRNKNKNSEKMPQAKQKVQQNVETFEESISNVRNMEKINRLEHQLGVKKTCSSQSIVTSENNTIKKDAFDIQKLINLQSVCMNKPARNGLKSLQKMRLQKKTKK